MLVADVNAALGEGDARQDVGGMSGRQRYPSSLFSNLPFLSPHCSPLKLSTDSISLMSGVSAGQDALFTLLRISRGLPEINYTPFFFSIQPNLAFVSLCFGARPTTPHILVVPLRLLELKRLRLTLVSTFCYARQRSAKLQQ